MIVAMVLPLAVSVLLGASRAVAGAPAAPGDRRPAAHGGDAGRTRCGHRIRPRGRRHAGGRPDPAGRRRGALVGARAGLGTAAYRRPSAVPGGGDRLRAAGGGGAPAAPRRPRPRAGRASPAGGWAPTSAGWSSIDDEEPDAYALPGLGGRVVVSTAMLRALPAGRAAGTARPRGRAPGPPPPPVGAGRRARRRRRTRSSARRPGRSGRRSSGGPTRSPPPRSGDRALAARALARAGLARAAGRGDAAVCRVALAGADAAVADRARALLAGPPPRRGCWPAPWRATGAGHAAAVLVASVETEDRVRGRGERVRDDPLTRSGRPASRQGVHDQAERQHLQHGTVAMSVGTEVSYNRPASAPPPTAAPPWTAAKSPYPVGPPARWARVAALTKLRRQGPSSSRDTAAQPRVAGHRGQPRRPARAARAWPPGRRAPPAGRPGGTPRAPRTGRGRPPARRPPASRSRPRRRPAAGCAASAAGPPGRRSRRPAGPSARRRPPRSPASRSTTSRAADCRPRRSPPASWPAVSAASSRSARSPRGRREGLRHGRQHVRRRRACCPAR